MPPKTRLRRPCREHEREWHGRCVDQGLEDDWLERLNGLSAFQLISVCQGHPVGQADPHGTTPHIKLRLREALLPQAADHWAVHKLTVVDTVARLFQDSATYVNLELKMRLRTSAGRLNYQEDLVVRVYRRLPRPAEAVDSDTRDWFERSVGRVEDFDALLLRLWYNGDSSADR